VRTLIGHQGVVKSIAFSADGRLLVSGSADKTVRVWELKSGHTIRIFGDPVEATADAGVNCLALSPDGKIVAAGGATTMIDLWRLD
jgi:WD40 repeat protein